MAIDRKQSRILDGINIAANSRDASYEPLIKI